ncbi:MAG: hypothetical protein ACFFCM_06565 [Promethearchaeota archaeon]
MPLIPLEPKKVPCPYCGFENYESVHKNVFLWKQDLERLIEGTLNTFECKNCHKLGWAKQLITINLINREKVYFLPIFPTETPKKIYEMGGYCFYEPLGQPLTLLKEFIDAYKEKYKFHPQRFLAVLD